MKKLKFALTLSVSILLVQACSNPSNMQSKVNSSRLSSETKNVYNSVPNKLNACIYEAGALVKMNDKYRNKVDELHKTLKDAKYYASISSQVTDHVRTTITPFYEYRVNDICNDISQDMMKEFKNDKLDSVNKASVK
ncbi:TPA: hypothetical protein ACXRUV_005111 [Klebsiella quasipneumoniae subsp. similipneumoniae]